MPRELLLLTQGPHVDTEIVDEAVANVCVVTIMPDREFGPIERIVGYTVIVGFAKDLRDARIESNSLQGFKNDLQNGRLCNQWASSLHAEYRNLYEACTLLGMHWMTARYNDPEAERPSGFVLTDGPTEHSYCTLNMWFADGNYKRMKEEDETHVVRRSRRRPGDWLRHGYRRHLLPLGRMAATRKHRELIDYILTHRNLATVDCWGQQLASPSS
ncbi:hypothetical protein BDV95DRAFT_658138 [Massariosphaeria phaeospora]|uniref:Uncharacterized protein n=1 Tax=Massariosphaeria phaeospora TaxID=100035 RepID=A0A7C8MDP8_9PLEO|nr:hypothetical protein BDV95DRAFT_658138 [Massariosphaeria phaeospora]